MIESHNIFVSKKGFKMKKNAKLATGDFMFYNINKP